MDRRDRERGVDRHANFTGKRSMRLFRLCDDETDDIAMEEEPALVSNNDVYERERLARIATSFVTRVKERKGKGGGNV